MNKYPTRDEVESYISSILESMSDAKDYEKTLVAGNIRHFYTWLSHQLLGMDPKRSTPNDDQDVLPPDLVVAMTLWGETRGESIEVKTTIASVIRNRALRRQIAYGYPLMVCLSSVCLQANQFSCWKDRKFVKDLPTTDDKDSNEWDELLMLAKRLISSEFQPFTLATHYHNLNDQPPSWVTNLKFVAWQGNYLFYLDPSWK